MSLVPPIEPARALSLTRTAFAISTTGLLALTALTELVSVARRFEGLALPAGLIGIVSPVIGRHLYEWLRQRVPRDAAVDARAAAFVTANVAGLAVTESAGLFGIVAYVFTGRIVALVGVLMHVILAGALWPTEERLAAFLEDET